MDLSIWHFLSLRFLSHCWPRQIRLVSYWPVLENGTKTLLVHSILRDPDIIPCLLFYIAACHYGSPGMGSFCEILYSCWRRLRATDDLLDQRLDYCTRLRAIVQPMVPQIICCPKIQPATALLYTNKICLVLMEPSPSKIWQCYCLHWKLMSSSWSHRALNVHGITPSDILEWNHVHRNHTHQSVSVRQRSSVFRTVVTTISSSVILPCISLRGQIYRYITNIFVYLGLACSWSRKPKRRLPLSRGTCVPMTERYAGWSS